MIARAVAVVGVTLAFCYNAAGIAFQNGPSADTVSYPLVQRENLIYQGAFRVPSGVYGNGRSTFGYGGTGLAFNPKNNSLFMVGHVWYQEVAEISVPEVRSSANVNALATATLLQPFAEMTEGRLPSVNPGDPNGIQIGGLLPYRDKLYATAFAYYDGNGTQSVSHFVSGQDLSVQGDVTGPYRVGQTGYTSGYMGLVPAAWQSALGGPVLNGQCCLNIISRTSYGPALFTIDPADIGVKDPAPATPLVYYTANSPLDAWNATSPYFNGTTQVKGVVFPEGTRSVLFFGRQGLGTFCYGPGTADASKAGTLATASDPWCYDPADSSKGVHAYPYKHYVWAYDALDLVSVKNGQKQPWDVKPYAIWSLDLPSVHTSGAAILSGAAYDPATGRIFVSQAFGDGDRPLIHVFTIPPPLDADKDGLSDAFETQFGLNPNSASGNDGASDDPDGDGFTNLQEYERGSNPTRTQVWPHVLDLNGDRGGDGFLYNISTGAWRFEVANRLSTGFTERPSAWDPGWQVYPANLNADEYTDFFLYDPVRGLWVQALNVNGGGTFTYTLGNWDRNWTVVPADLDGDGRTDLFVYNVTTGAWVKCFVDGRGDFAGYTKGTWDPGWTFFTADLNGDGRDDFFLYNRVNGVWVETFSQGGFGAFDYPVVSRWDPGWQVYPTDLNGDGRTDLFLLNAAGVHVSALSRTMGDFDYVGGPRWTPGWSVSSGDLNADGSSDLFLYNPTTGAWVEAFSNGAGDFTYTAGQWDPGWSVRMTDLNEDGRGDLLLDRADGTWVQATNKGTATFTYAAGNWGTGWTVFTRRPSDR